MRRNLGRSEVWHAETELIPIATFLWVSHLWVPFPQVGPQSKHKPSPSCPAPSSLQVLTHQLQTTTTIASLFRLRIMKYFMWS